MTYRYEITTRNAAETQSLAAKLASQLLPGDILALAGNLASGKTTFTQGLASFFQVEEYALSPTFTYINEYHGKYQDLVHIDAYRLSNGKELIAMGIWEYYESGSIVVIEWADIVPEAIPEGSIGISLRTSEQDPGSREIIIASPRALELS